MTAQSPLLSSPLPNMLDAVNPGLVLKLTPPRLRKRLLPRERLRQMRVDADDCSVILLEAPAGYGKTSLLALWRQDWQQAGAQVCWFDLDSDDTISSVGGGLIEGLRRATGQPNFGHESLEALLRGSGLAQAITSLLAEIAENAHPTVIILDNGERIDNPELIELCNYLLHNLPPNLQIVIGSRVRSPLAVGDLLAHGLLRRVTAKNLQFTLEETHSLLNQQLGNKADLGLAARLHEITEGWPLGLHLAVNALEQASDLEQALQRFGKSGDEATQQLVSGFLAYLPEELRDFALRCSLLDALHPDLCNAITGHADAEQLLERLSNETALLTHIENSEWLRLHPLVREYSRSAALASLSAAEQQEIHSRAWRWLAEQGDTEQAARHALASGQTHEAFALIADSLYDSAIKHGHYGTVTEWLARLPETEIFQHRSLRLTAGWNAALSGDWKRAEHFVLEWVEPPHSEPALYQEALAILAVANSKAERIDIGQRYIDAYPLDAPDSLASRSMLHIRAFNALFSGASEEARHLLLSLPDDNSYFTQRVFHDRSIGHIYLWEGRPARAEAAVRRRYAECESIAGRSNGLTKSLASVLATACWERDERAEARSLLAFRFDLDGRPGGIMWSERSYLTQASIAAAEGDENRAFALLEALAGIGSTQGILSTRLLSLVERIRLHAARHRTGQCLALLASLDRLFAQEAAATPGNLHPLLNLYYALAHSFAALSEDNIPAAANHLEQAWPLALQLNRGREMVQVLAMQALVEQRKGESPTELLNAALSHAESGGQVRVFADTLPEIIDLIEHWSSAGHASSDISPSFIQQVLNATKAQSADNSTQPSASPAVSAAASAFLTPKESEVLQLLAGGLPNKRIASTMGLSNETIKWHMKKLFTKLNAANRQHAVGRARLLGLLD